MTPAIRGAITLALAAMVAACGIIPRGAPIEREIVRASESGYQDFAVYPVNRDFLAIVRDWPITGEPRLNWISASHGSRTQTIRPGDVLTVRIWDSDLNSLLVTEGARQTDLMDIRVSPSGSIFLPYIGDTRVGGLTPERARERVQFALEAISPSAQVQLAMAEGRANSVDLVGGVGAPGNYPLPDNAFTILSLISAGGGVSGALENPQVRLRRDGALYGTSLARLYAEPRLDTRLQGGDQVIVEEDRRYFLSLGATGVEAQHYFNADVITALDALAIIGGVQDSRADPQGVLILREYPVTAVRPGQPGPRAQRVVFAIDLTTSDGLFSARHFRIHPGDLVLGTEAPVTAAQTIASLIGSAFGIVSQAGSVARTASNAAN